MRKILLYALIGLAALAAGFVASLFLASREQAPAPAPAARLQGGTALLGQEKPLPAFRLVRAGGQPFTNADLKGHWSFLFFGYTSCPDVCPTSLQDIALTLDRLHRDAPNLPVQGVFVSVDPARDSPAKLGEYVRFFHAGLIGASGDDTTLQRLTRSLGIVYSEVPDPNHPDNYFIDHSAAILVIDPQGRLAAVLHPPHDPEVMAADLQRLARFRGGR